MKALTRAGAAFFVIAAANLKVVACPWCRIEVVNGIYDENFGGTLVMLLVPVLILAGIGIGIYNLDKILHKFKGDKK